MTSFLDFATRLADINCPAGDFCADYVRAPMSEEPANWAELRRFVTARSGDRLVLDAARAAWNAYSAFIA